MQHSFDAIVRSFFETFVRGKEKIPPTHPSLVQGQVWVTAGFNHRESLSDQKNIWAFWMLLNQPQSYWSGFSLQSSVALPHWRKIMTKWAGGQWFLQSTRTCVSGTHANFRISFEDVNVHKRITTCCDYASTESSCRFSSFVGLIAQALFDKDHRWWKEKALVDLTFWWLAVRILATSSAPSVMCVCV